ncbi:hypothetical protein NYZ99_12440 [Maribacter litopenaei]|uniref:Fucose isomerase n=1 Tax=Maribacter litopenaei TaxID=2976127 RepID=A0ABY5Y6R0_9FLAO|nr:hypothetical protein [Maribacter litopenaei]UWX53924.1 hypothetical protein NYZ99_12440 [Maribacter litopenaei]
MSKANLPIGIIIGNRDFFPDSLVEKAVNRNSEVFKKLNLTPILLEITDTKLGGVEVYKDSQKCADLFKKHRDEIGGILVLLPNFGDERGVADTLKLANLNVPVLVQAYPDELSKMNVVNRRDSWCGKISVCNNLYQYGIKYSLTSGHVMSPAEEAFQKDLLDFVAVCRVVKGLRNVRIGAVGARPGAFNTVRYSEKILQRNGITVTTVHLSEILGKADKLTKDDAAVKQHPEAINSYAPKGKTPDAAMIQMAKLDVIPQSVRRGVRLGCYRHTMLDIATAEFWL